MKSPVQPSTAKLLAADSGRPTPRFRRDSWTAIQQALDPLGRPRPLPAR